MREDGIDGAASEPARSRLIGRDDALDLLGQVVRRPDVRVVTVTGRSGVGKTALAATVAAAIEAEDGIHITRAQVDRHGAGAGTDEVAAALSQASEGVAGPAPAGRRRLVLLDGLEAVSGSSELVAAALAADPGLTVLATSVVPLSLPGEQVLRLDPLALPDAGDASAATQRAAPAVRLLLARIQEAGGDHREPDVAAAAALTRLLDGLPLALELAAARCADRTLAQVLDEVERSSPLHALASSPSAAEPHHRSLRSTILWSYGLLDEDHQRTLRRLGVFTGSFSPASLEAVTGGRTDHLPRLVATGLAREVGGGSDDGRFELVPSVSLVARELLDADSDLVPTQDRHAEHHLALAAASAPTLRSPATPAVRRALLAELDDLVAAVRHLERTGRHDDALQLLVDLGLMWEESSAAARAAQLLADLLPARSDDLDDDLPTVAQVRALAAMLAVWGQASTSPWADQLDALAHDAALLGSESPGVPLLMVRRSQVALHLAAGQTEPATAAAEAGLDAARALGDTWWTTQFLGWSAAAHAKAGDQARAEGEAVEGRDLALLEGDTAQLLRLSHILVGMSVIGGAAEGGPMSEDDLIVLAARLDDAHAEGLLHIGAAIRGAGTGDVPGAAAHLVAALDLGRRHDLWYLEELALVAGVVVTTVGGRPEDTARLHGAMHDVLPWLQRALAPESVQLYGAVIARARAQIGDEAFERAEARGRLLDWEDATVLAAAVGDELAAARSAPGPSDPDGPLSPRQAEVLAMLALGRTNKEIALELGMRPKTVMHHTSEIYRRLEVRNRTEAVAEGQRLGLLRTAG